MHLTNGLIYIIALKINFSAVQNQNCGQMFALLIYWFFGFKSFFIIIIISHFKTWITEYYTVKCFHVIKLLKSFQMSNEPTYLSYFWLTLFWLSKTCWLQERIGSKESEKQASWIESILDSLTLLNRFFRIQ